MSATSKQIVVAAMGGSIIGLFGGGLLAKIERQPSTHMTTPDGTQIIWSNGCAYVRPLGNGGQTVACPGKSGERAR